MIEPPRPPRAPRQKQSQILLLSSLALLATLAVHTLKRSCDNCPTIKGMKFQAVIFDMDGLMLDTECIYRDVFNRAAADCHLEFPSSLHEKLLGRNTADTHTILR